MRLEELFLEVELTSRKHIVVEGRTDERFIKAWLQDLDPGENVVVTPVENLLVEATDVEAIGLNNGNRGRVVFVAMRASKSNVDLRCIADRDCGHHVIEHTYGTLNWTDFPALESYALDAKTLQKANLLSFDGRLPPGNELLRMLAPALKDLYAVRAANEHLERPNYSAGLSKGQSLSDFKVSLTVPHHIRPQVEGYARSTSDDPREFAYGHDIGELLLLGFGNDIKNKVGIQSLGAVESALRSAVQAVGTFKEQPLFVHLKGWING